MLNARWVLNTPRPSQVTIMVTLHNTLNAFAVEHAEVGRWVACGNMMCSCYWWALRVADVPAITFHAKC